MKKAEAVIWGAGKIGRGFLGEICSDAGYNITFIEYARGLVDQLRKAGKYTVHKAKGIGEFEELTIDAYEVYNTDDHNIITEKVLQDNTVIAIAVHQKALPEVIRTLAPGVMEKAKRSSNSTLDIILCINMSHPAGYCRKLFEENLPVEYHSYLENNIGLIESVVMRICPEATKEMLEKDPLAVLTNGFPEMPVDKKAFKGSVPDTTMLRLTDNIEAEETRKIYTLNMAHAMLAYLGTPKEYSFSADCIADPKVRKIVTGALDEAAQGLSAEFGFKSGNMEKWNRDIVRSLENPALKDQLNRLGADTMRKLGRYDRIVGPAMLCWKIGIKPAYLIEGIASGFRFNQSNDPGTEEVQHFLRENGIESAVRKFCGLEDEELIGLIVRAYESN